MKWLRRVLGWLEEAGRRGLLGPSLRQDRPPFTARRASDPSLARRRRVQPADQGSTRPLLNHDVDQRETQSPPTVLRQDEHVRAIGKSRTVAHGSGEADHVPGALLVAPHDSASPGDLKVDIMARAPAPPVGVLRQELPDHIEVHPTRVVSETVAHSPHASRGSRLFGPSGHAEQPRRAPSGPSLN